MRDCKENGGNAVFQLTDVTSEENIKGAVDRAVKEFGKLDIIYNNAGLGGAIGPIEKTAADNWDRTFSILLRAVSSASSTRRPRFARPEEARSSRPPRLRDCAARPEFPPMARRRRASSA